nr:MAG TPA: hypothetical protein [Caudoviricetes sp.]
MFFAFDVSFCLHLYILCNFNKTICKCLCILRIVK